MLALKAYSPCAGAGKVLQQNHVSLKLLLQDISAHFQHLHSSKSSICQVLKSFPIFGACFTKINNRSQNIYNKEESGRSCRQEKLICESSSSFRENSGPGSEYKNGGVGIENRSHFSKLLSNFFKQFISNSVNTSGIMSTVEAMAQLENNTQTADNLIQEIYSKLAVLQNCDPGLGVEAQKLIQENEALKQEVQIWKEMLILQQIKNGGCPVVRDAKLLERSAVVASSDTTVKQEVAPSQPQQQTEVKSEAAPPQQQPGKKGKSKGGDGNAGGGAPKAGKQKGGADQAAAPDAQGNEEVDVGRLDLRIGLIKECTRHPDADSLYVEKIDVGEPNVRTVISGLVKHVPIDAMQNRMVVVLCNLKPSKMRGIMSEAMVMCASSPEKVEILTPPSGSAPGDLIEVEGYTRRPEAIMNPKKKIFETVAPDLKTNDKKQATYKGVPWTVPGKGFVVAESLVNVNVK